MINTQNNKKTRLLYLMAFPAIAAILFAFSSREAMEPIENAGNELAEILAPEMKEPPYEELQLPQGEHIPSIFPLKEVEAIRLSSSFGRRMDPIDKVEKHHNGIDFATASGNEVIATADGEVVFAGRDGRHGNRVKIKHGETYLTTYSHLESISVYNGQKVSKGDVIALSGNTGASTAPHLHYGVSKNGKYVNPTDYIKDYDFKRKVKIKEKSKDKVKTKEKDQKTTYKVLIDAGHGGNDEGAISPSGITEKELSLAIAQKIQAILESEDKIVVELSRHVDTELSLQDRVDMTAKADLLISLHTDNYSEEGSFVFPVYYPNNEFSERSLELANHLVDEFQKIGKEAKSGYSDGYKVLRDAACPAVIFNYGFFSDPEEERFLSSESGQQQVANGIAEAVKSSLL